MLPLPTVHTVLEYVDVLAAALLQHGLQGCELARLEGKNQTDDLAKLPQCH